MLGMPGQPQLRLESFPGRLLCRRSPHKLHRPGTDLPPTRLRYVRVRMCVCYVGEGVLWARSVLFRKTRYQSEPPPHSPSSLSDKPFLERFGISPKDFDVMSKVAGWYTSFLGDGEEADGDHAGGGGGIVDSDGEGPGGSHGLTRSQMASAGLRAKMVIEAGRLEFLVDGCGFGPRGAHIVRYCPRGVSRENMLLLAARPDAPSE